jgi:hypothetical protein
MLIRSNQYLEVAWLILGQTVNRNSCVFRVEENEENRESKAGKEDTKETNKLNGRG